MLRRSARLLRLRVHPERLAEHLLQLLGDGLALQRGLRPEPALHLGAHRVVDAALLLRLLLLLLAHTAIVTQVRPKGYARAKMALA